MTITDSGSFVLIVRVVSNPFKTGIVTFRTTTSGFNRQASSISPHYTACAGTDNAEQHSASESGGNVVHS
jgi:hypothetical protein